MTTDETSGESEIRRIVKCGTNDHIEIHDDHLFTMGSEDELKPCPFCGSRLCLEFSGERTTCSNCIGSVADWVVDGLWQNAWAHKRIAGLKLEVSAWENAYRETNNKLNDAEEKIAALEREVAELKKKQLWDDPMPVIKKQFLEDLNNGK